jgi:CheY-like chemotaxis protein
MNTCDATVLVVDDELELLDIFSTWLRRSGYRVLTAPNGAEALKLLAVERVDTLISDIRMPVMDGTNLVRHIYDMGFTIPSIIFLSGFGQADPREMHALGVEAILGKPLHRRDLLFALEQGLKQPEDLWLAAPAEPMQQRVSINLAGVEDVARRRQFQLGRGGCCFPCNQRLAPEATIDLTILFPGAGTSLRAQGDVRWYRPGAALAGMAFRHLETDCRGWVVDLIRASKPRSFIPCGIAEDLPTAPCTQLPAGIVLVEVT